MADYCQQCSVDLFGKDFRELAGLGRGKKLDAGMGWTAMCEWCGLTLVDDEGRCIAPQCTRHGSEDAKSRPTAPRYV